MSPSVPALFTATGLGLSISMAIAWVLQRRTGQSGWIDATWSFSVGAAGAILALAPLERGAPSVRQFLVAAALLTASLRLGLHIARRSVNAPEDPRYAAFAREWAPPSPNASFGSCKFKLSALLSLLRRFFSRRGTLRQWAVCWMGWERCFY